MKKRILMLLLALVLVSASVSAIGIGVQGGGAIGNVDGGDLAITFKLDTAPWVFAVNARISSAATVVGISADQWVLNDTITGSLKWFIGWGLYANVLIADPIGFGLGGRLPIGLNMFFADGFVEPYLQVAPSIGLGLHNESFGFDWFIPINLGIRFWI